MVKLTYVKGKKGVGDLKVIIETNKGGEALQYALRALEDNQIECNEIRLNHKQRLFGIPENHARKGIDWSKRKNLVHVKSWYTRSGLYEGEDKRREYLWNKFLDILLNTQKERDKFNEWCEDIYEKNLELSQTK